MTSISQRLFLLEYFMSVFNVLIYSHVFVHLHFYDVREALATVLLNKQTRRVAIIW